MLIWSAADTQNSWVFWLQNSNSLLLRMCKEYLRCRSIDNAPHICCFLEQNIKLAWGKEELAAEDIFRLYLPLWNSFYPISRKSEHGNAEQAVFQLLLLASLIQPNSVMVTKSSIVTYNYLRLLIALLRNATKQASFLSWPFNYLPLLGHHHY